MNTPLTVWIFFFFVLLVGFVIGLYVGANIASSYKDDMTNE